VALFVWNESTREELQDILPKSMVLLPTGATEQHGHHLATGHDTLMVSTIARRAAERASADCNIVLAPTLPFGSSHHHLPFGGTLSLSTGTYFRVVRDLVESMLSSGARRIYVLNGHGGNHELNQLAVRDVAAAESSGAQVHLAAASYWDIVRSEIQAIPRFATLTLPGHAGQFETATMLATDPTLVREVGERRTDDPSRKAAINGTRVETSGRWAQFDGYTDFPERAVVEDGTVLLDTVVGSVAEALVAFSRLTDQSPPTGDAT
jgi:creatinine amidohydrolase